MGLFSRTDPYQVWGDRLVGMAWASSDKDLRAAFSAPPIGDDMSTLSSAWAGLLLSLVEQSTWATAPVPVDRARLRKEIDSGWKRRLPAAPLDPSTGENRFLQVVRRAFEQPINDWLASTPDERQNGVAAERMSLVLSVFHELLEDGLRVPLADDGIFRLFASRASDIDLWSNQAAFALSRCR